MAATTRVGEKTAIQKIKYNRLFISKKVRKSQN